MQKCFNEKCSKEATRMLHGSDGKPFYGCNEHAREIQESGAMVMTVFLKTFKTSR